MLELRQHGDGSTLCAVARMESAFAKAFLLRPADARLTPDYGGQDGATGSMRLIGLMGFKSKMLRR